MNNVWQRGREIVLVWLVMGLCMATRDAGAAVAVAQTVQPLGRYEVVTLTLRGAGENDSDIQVQIPMRDGQPVRLSYAPQLEEGLGHVIPPAGNARARIFAQGMKWSADGAGGDLEFRSWGDDWGGSIRNHALVFRGTIELKRHGRDMEGRYSGRVGTDHPEADFRSVQGRVVGSWLTDAEMTQLFSLPDGADYPTYYGKGDFAMPSAGVPMMDNLSMMRLVWRSEEWLPTGPGSTSRAKIMNTASCNGLLGSPVLANGVIYVSCFIPSGDVLDPEYRAWLEANPHADALSVWLTRQAGLLIADDVVSAIDAASGKTLWRTVFKGRGMNQQGHKSSTGRDSPTPAVAGGIVYARGSLGMVYALDAKTGAALWEYEPPCVARNRGNRQTPIEGGGSPGSPIIVVEPADGKGAVVVCGSNTDPVFALDAKTGVKLWEGKRAYAQCWIKDGVQRVLLASPGELACVEPRVGKVLWTIPSDSQTVSVSGDYLVMEARATGQEQAWVCTSGTAYRLRVDGADKLWKVNDVGYDGGRPISVVEGVAFFTPSYGVKRVVIATGQVGAAQASGGNCHGGWAAGDRLLYVDDGKHGGPGHSWFDISGETPQLLWRGTLPCPRTTDYGMQITHLIADGRLLVRGKDGMYCFDLRMSPDRRVLAALTKARQGRSDEAQATLLKLALDPDRDTRRAVLEVFGRLRYDSDEVVTALSKGLTDQDWRTRLAAAGSLEHLGEAALPLWRVVWSDAEPDVRQLAAAQLGQSRISVEQKLSLLEKAVRDKDLHVVAAAASSLGRLGAPALPVIQTALQDETDPARRTRLARALAALGPAAKDALPSLLKLAGSDDLEESRVAALALVRLGENVEIPLPLTVQCMDRLVEVLGTLNQADVKRASAILIQCGAAAVPSLMKAYTTHNPFMMMRGGDVLVAIGEPSIPALPLLEKAQKGELSRSGTFVKSLQRSIDALRALEKKPTP